MRYEYLLIRRKAYTDECVDSLNILGQNLGYELISLGVRGDYTDCVLKRGNNTTKWEYKIETIPGKVCTEEFMKILNKERKDGKWELVSFVQKSYFENPSVKCIFKRRKKDL